MARSCECRIVLELVFISPISPSWVVRPVQPWSEFTSAFGGTADITGLAAASTPVASDLLEYFACHHPSAEPSWLDVLIRLT
jgi:hypothetical protein